MHFASRHPEIFSSYPNITIGDQSPEIAEYFGSMISLDDPRHARLRNIVSRAFTPKVVARIEDSIRDRARGLVSDLIANHPDGNAELVTELSGPLPLQIICDMMGIPEADHQQIFRWTNVILGFGDPDLATDFAVFMKSAIDIGAYATALAEDRRINPRDDLTTALVAAEVDGEQLNSAEIASFFILLAIAGNETTRNAISHGVLALTRYPEQRDIWWNDFTTHTPTAVEEIVRWASPVVYMRRTAKQDVDVSGVKIAEGRQGHHVVRLGQSRRGQVRQPVDVRRDPRDTTTTSDSAAAECISAWAPTWPAARSRSCSRNCAPGFPISRPPKSRPCCCRPSFTASSGCPSAGPCEHDDGPDMTVRERLNWLALHGVVRAIAVRAARRGDPQARLIADPAVRADPIPFYEELRSRGPLIRGRLSYLTVDHAVAHELASIR